MKVDHFAFQVSDMDKAIEFYTKLLGIEARDRSKDEEHQEEFCFFPLDGGDLELLSKLNSDSADLKADDPRKRMNSPHLALKKEHLDEFAQFLREEGYNIIDGPLVIPEKVKWMYIADPDGNVIEFVEWLD